MKARRQAFVVTGARQVLHKLNRKRQEKCPGGSTPVRSVMAARRALAECKRHGRHALPTGAQPKQVWPKQTAVM
jgi:hypothetical protein